MQLEDYFERNTSSTFKKLRSVHFLSHLINKLFVTIKKIVYVMQYFGSNISIHMSNNIV